MQITLKIIGKDLFQHLTKQRETATGAFPTVYHDEPIDWHLAYTSADLCAEDLLCFPEFPSVLLVEAHDTVVIEKIQSVERQVHAFMKSNPQMPMMLGSVIMVFQSPALLVNAHEFPDFISDWMFTPVLVHDLARRIFLSLKRKNVLRTRLRFGSVTLIPDSRSIIYEGKVARLTPSEFVLAELFLGQIGKVISFRDLVQFFKSTGKSTAPNNIRVAIYQLRLSLEILTKSQLMLTNVYKQGYCMRYRSPATALSKPPISNKVAV